MRSAVPAPPGAAVALFGPATESAVPLRVPAGDPRRRAGADRSPGGSAAVGTAPAELRRARGTGARRRRGGGHRLRAGLPGLVIAMLRPQVRMTLLEPMLRRTTFLGECITELGLGNVTVCRGRAEDMAGVIRADVAISRAVAPLGRLAELSVGVVRPGGTILALKGDHAQAELDEAGPVLRQSQCTECRSSEGGPRYRRTTGHGRPYSGGRQGAEALDGGADTRPADGCERDRAERRGGPRPARPFRQRGGDRRRAGRGEEQRDGACGGPWVARPATRRDAASRTAGTSPRARRAGRAGVVAGTTCPQRPGSGRCGAGLAR